MKTKYTSEKNILMLISLLKEYNIKKIVVSPGAMNVSLIGSIQDDDFFEIYSCVDERSACYMACGLAAESGEIVALSCTGATSSRNYMPGLTEAFYRKLPILAITSAKPLYDIGHNIPQVLDRTTPLNDIVKMSVQVPIINNQEEEWACNIQINKALLELTHNTPGPVHINLMTNFSRDYSTKQLPRFRKINRYSLKDKFPKLSHNKIAIFVGAHNKWNIHLEKEVDLFCEKYNAIVLCDSTSNYFGKYRILGNLIYDQESYDSEYKELDLVIYIGNISGSYMNFKTKDVWRVNPDGILRDQYRKLSNVFEMDEIDFFEKYNSLNKEKSKNTIYCDLINEYKEYLLSIDENKIPYSNIWTALKLSQKLPEGTSLHLAILNSLRSWNFFECKNKVFGYCNTGGFGIDGMISTMLGASLINKNKNYFGVLGDLAFFYDMNTLGNINVGSNIRLLLINNGCGTEFHNYSHNAQVLGNKVSRYVAADGHFGNKSINLVKDIAKDLGYEYLSASNKEDFLSKIDYFTNDKIYDKPIIFEIFTNSNDESNALRYIRNLKITPTKKIKNDMKKVISPELRDKLKKFIKG